MTDEKILYTTCTVGLIRFINNSEGKQLHYIYLISDAWCVDPWFFNGLALSSLDMLNSSQHLYVFIGTSTETFT